MVRSRQTSVCVIEGGQQTTGQIVCHVQQFIVIVVHAHVDAEQPAGVRQQ
jgi:hypothetical protein